MSDSDLLFDEGDDQEYDAPASATAWRVLIVDDDAEVHVATRLALSDVIYLNRPLEFVSAYSGAEARESLAKLNDVAIILLDVVMESDDSGLRLVQHIRESLNWHETRIVLRTGQPGTAPERDVILRYDINDYKAKSELTDSRLFTTVVAALRSYRHLRNLEESRCGLRKVIDAAGSLHQGHSMELFANGVLHQIAAILDGDSNSILCTHRHIDDSGDVTLLAGSGRFSGKASMADGRVFGEEVNRRLVDALKSRSSVFGPDHAAIYLRTPHGREVITYVESSKSFRDLDLTLLEMFSHNISIGYDNLEMYQELLEANDGLERRVTERTMELRQFKAAVEHSSASILITDPDGVIVHANQSVCETSLYSLEQLIGQTPRVFRSGLVAQETFASLWSTIRSGADWRGELLNRRANGELYWEDVTISPVTDDVGAITHFVVVKEDISHRKALEEELRRLATIDGLTGVLNRQTFAELGAEEFRRCRQHTSKLAAMMIDIDHFKAVNDTFGHQTGDRVIQLVAKVCRASLRDRDILGRVGGEEFACLLPDITPEQLLVVAERLRSTVAAETIQLDDGKRCSVTVSVGLGEMVQSDEDIGASLGRADAALYEAKQSGRDRVCTSIWLPRVRGTA